MSADFESNTPSFDRARAEEELAQAKIESDKISGERAKLFESYMEKYDAITTEQNASMRDVIARDLTEINDQMIQLAHKSWKASSTVEQLQKILGIE